MSPIITALYDTRGEADRALASVIAEVTVRHAGVYDNTPASLENLRHLDLTPEDFAACQRKLATNEHLLIAQAERAEDVEDIIAALEEGADESPISPPTPPALPGGTPTRSPPVVQEERLPLVEEELRVGTREVIRGGARVHTRIEETPHTEDIELLEETLRVHSRPAGRPIDERELESAGLMKERVVEIAQIREEAVVKVGAFVREEVVVSKVTERRVEHIHETLRHTEVETEDLGANPRNTERTLPRT